MSARKFFAPLLSIKDKTTHKLILIGSESLIRVDSYTYLNREGIYKGIGTIQPIIRNNGWLRLSKFFRRLDPAYQGILFNITKKYGDHKLRWLYFSGSRPSAVIFRALFNVAVFLSGLSNEGMLSIAKANQLYIMPGVFCAGEQRPVEFFVRQQVFDRLKMVNDVKNFYKDIAEFGEVTTDAPSGG